jgi:hypothetical protein
MFYTTTKRQHVKQIIEVQQKAILVKWMKIILSH